MATVKNDNTNVSEAEAQKLYDEALKLNEETKKLLLEFKEKKTETVAADGENAEINAILAGIKANEARMKDKVDIRIEIDKLNRSNKHLFCGVGTDAVKIERGKTVKVSRAMYDSVKAAVEQETKALDLMDERSNAWNPEAWRTGEA